MIAYYLAYFRPGPADGSPSWLGPVTAEDGFVYVYSSMWDATIVRQTMLQIVTQRLVVIREVHIPAGLERFKPEDLKYNENGWNDTLSNLIWEAYAKHAVPLKVQAPRDLRTRKLRGRRE